MIGCGFTHADLQSQVNLSDVVAVVALWVSLSVGEGFCLGLILTSGVLGRFDDLGLGLGLGLGSGSSETPIPLYGSL